MGKKITYFHERDHKISKNFWNTGIKCAWEKKKQMQTDIKKIPLQIMANLYLLNPDPNPYTFL